MLRKILAVPAGLLLGVLCISVIEKSAHYLFPRPAAMNADNIDALKHYVETAPVMALLFVIIGYAVGAFTAGFSSTKIAGDGKKIYAVICGLIFLLQGIYMMYILPTPIWFWISGIAVWGLVLVGYKSALNKKIT